MPDSPEKSTGDSKYLFSSSMTLILRLRESPPGCIMARYSRSLLAINSNLSLSSCSSCSLLRMISICSEHAALKTRDEL